MWLRLRDFVTLNKDISRKFENFKNGPNTIKNNIKTTPCKLYRNHCLRNYFRVVTKSLRCYIVYIYTFLLEVEFNIKFDCVTYSNNLKNNKLNQLIWTFRTCTFDTRHVNYEYKEITATKKLLKGNETDLNVMRGRVFTFPFFVNIVVMNIRSKGIYYE